MFILLAATWQEAGMEFLTLLLFGIAALFLIIVGLVILFYGGAMVKGGFRQFVQADHQLAGFGQTETGKYVYNRAVQLSASFDEVTDPAIVKTTAFLNGLYANLPALLLRALPDTSEPLETADVLKAVNVVRNGLLELLNGVPIDATTPEQLLDRLQNPANR